MKLKLIFAVMVILSGVLAGPLVLLDSQVTGGTTGGGIGVADAGANYYIEASGIDNATGGCIVGLEVYVKKTAGTPGDLYVTLVNDSGGFPVNDSVNYVPIETTSKCMDFETAFVDAAPKKIQFNFTGCAWDGQSAWFVMNTTDSLGVTNTYGWDGLGGGDAVFAKQPYYPPSNWAGLFEARFYLYGNDSACAVPPPPPVVNEVVLTSPADNTISNDDTPTVTYVPNISSSILGCDLFANDVYRTTNASSVTNASSNTLTPPSLGSQAQYDLKVTCYNISANFNSSAVSYFLDTEAPEIFWRTQPINVEYGSASAYIVDFQDWGELENTTVNIFHGNGTLHSQDYQNLTVGGQVVNVSDSAGGLAVGLYFLEANSWDTVGNYSSLFSSNFSVTNVSTALNCYYDSDLITEGMARDLSCEYTSAGAAGGITTYTYNFPSKTDFYAGGPADWIHYNASNPLPFPVNYELWVNDSEPGWVNVGNMLSWENAAHVAVVNTTTDFEFTFYFRGDLQTVPGFYGAISIEVVDANNFTVAGFDYTCPSSGAVFSFYNNATTFHTNSSSQVCERAWRHSNQSGYWWEGKIKRDIINATAANYSAWYRIVKGIDAQPGWSDYYYGGSSIYDTDANPELAIVDTASIRIFGHDVGVTYEHRGFGNVTLSGVQTDLIPGVTCYYDSDSFSGNNGTAYQHSFAEPHNDGVTITRDVGCWAPNFQPQTTSISYTNAYWIHGTNYVSFLKYNDTSLLSGSEGVGSGVTKCSRFVLPSFGTISPGDRLRVISAHSEPGTDEQSEFRIVGVSADDTPNLSNERFRCLYQRGLDSALTIYECLNSTTDAIFQEGTYFFCVENPDYVSMNTDVPPKGTMCLDIGVGFSCLEGEPAFAMVYGGSSNTSTGDVQTPRVSGKIYDGASNIFIPGINVQLISANDTFVVTSGTDGSYAFTNLEAGKPYWLYVSQQPGYDTWDYRQITGKTIILCEDDPTCNDLVYNIYLSPRVGLIRLRETMVTSYGDFELNNDYLDNITIPKDATLSSINVIIEDEDGEVPDTSLNISISTTCTYAVNPTDYFLKQRTGTSIFDIIAVIGGENTTLLLASCGDGAYFTVTYQSVGLFTPLRANFEGQDITARNFRAYRGSQGTTGYSSLYALYELFAVKDNTKLTNETDGISCNTTIYNSTRNQISNVTWTTLYNDNRVEANVTNFTLTPSTPASVIINARCIAPGYELLNAFSDPITTASDVFNVTDCRIEDELGLRYEYMKPSQIRHIVCTLSTFNGVDLSGVTVTAAQQENNIRRRLTFKKQVGNETTWSIAFTNILPKGWWTWKLEFENLPSGLEDGVEFQTFTRVYDSPPRKISPDFCDGTNCPKILHKGQDYFCSITTEFETEYTREDMWIQVDGSKYDFPISIVRSGNQWIHTIILAQVGLSGEYGITDDTETIKCFTDFFIDGESVYYSLTTSYDPKQAFDLFGINAFVTGTLRSTNPTEQGGASSIGFLEGIAGAVFGLFSGEGDLFTALFWLIVIGVLISIGVVMLTALSRRRGK